MDLERQTQRGFQLTEVSPPPLSYKQGGRLQSWQHFLHAASTGLALLRCGREKGSKYGQTRRTAEL